ncbi:hypothetical protein M8C21_001500 [Ambrosia artemisiifolia]|uniref:DUF676 domain-containing protein n=1 Tax=Ambrosia artemisiifolia TaxID=4212 RepID=A0AAD5G3W5_AMBAR|nr:hypothetical protein M8C21_001500 [Ambrosia artemisiifolia]
MFVTTSNPSLSPLTSNLSSGFRAPYPRLVVANGGVRIRKRMELVRKVGRKCCGCVRAAKKDGEDEVSPGANVNSDHVLIMVNGITGSAADWRYAAKQFVKRLPDKVIVHCSECNSSTLTFDGVDRMGERLAEEISFISHSLGGLVARYAIGRLYENVPISRSSNLKQNDSEQAVEQLFEARIAGLQPVNFITVATPHLGSRGHRQLPFLCGLPFLERRAPQTAHWIVGRSGKHLFLTDNDNGGRPLLLQMVNDSENIKFMSALGSFKRRVAYANTNYDLFYSLNWGNYPFGSFLFFLEVVGWRTSSIRRQHELPKDEKYPHIVYVERQTSDAIQNEISFVDIPQNLEEEMIRGLTQVPWERVDVKNYWLNSDGADIDHLQIGNNIPKLLKFG